MVKRADLEPVPPGVKVIMTVHEPLAAMVPAFEQVPPLRAKSPGLLPVMVKKGFAKTSDAVPELDTVKVIPALVVFCS